MTIYQNFPDGGPTAMNYFCGAGWSGSTLYRNLSTAAATTSYTRVTVTNDRNDPSSSISSSPTSTSSTTYTSTSSSTSSFYSSTSSAPLAGPTITLPLVLIPSSPPTFSGAAPISSTTSSSSFTSSVAILPSITSTPSSRTPHPWIAGAAVGAVGAIALTGFAFWLGRRASRKGAVPASPMPDVGMQYTNVVDVGGTGKAELDVPAVDMQHTNAVNVRDTAMSEMNVPAYQPAELPSP